MHACEPLLVNPTALIVNLSVTDTIGFSISHMIINEDRDTPISIKHSLIHLSWILVHYVKYFNFRDGFVLMLQKKKT